MIPLPGSRLRGGGVCVCVWGGGGHIGSCDFSGAFHIIGPTERSLLIFPESRGRWFFLCVFFCIFIYEDVPFPFPPSSCCSAMKITTPPYFGRTPADIWSPPWLKCVSIRADSRARNRRAQCTRGRVYAGFLFERSRRSRCRKKAKRPSASPPTPHRLSVQKLLKIRTHTATVGRRREREKKKEEKKAAPNCWNEITEQLPGIIGGPNLQGGDQMLLNVKHFGWHFHFGSLVVQTRCIAAAAVVGVQQTDAITAAARSQTAPLC